MMEYLRKSFSVFMGRSEAYRENYDKIDWGPDRKTSVQVLEEKRAEGAVQEA